MQRPSALFSLALLAACDPTSNGGGTGGAGGGASSSAASSSSSSATSAAGSGGMGGAGGGASSSAASTSSSSGAGTGGGGVGLTVAWTKIITTAPSMYPLDLKASVVSAETPNRVFVGGTLRGSYTFASTTLHGGGLVHDAAVVLAFDSAGTEVSNLQFGSTAYGLTPGCFATDAASNLFVAGGGSGVNGYEIRYVQKYGASPWIKAPGYQSNSVSAGVERLEVDAAGNPMAHLSVTPPGLDFGGGLQSGSILLKLDGATGGYLWSKPAPSGTMHGDASGDLLFLGGSPLTLTRLDSSGATLAVKSYTGAATSVALATGASGILITAQLQGTADFGCGPLTSAGSGKNLLVIKLDTAGTCVYSRRFDPAGFPGTTPMTIALTGAGDAVITGTSTSPADFGGGPLPAGQFVLKLDPAGAFVSTWSMATPAEAAIDDSGAIYFVSSSPSFDVGTGPLLAGTRGMAIAKLVP